MKKLYILLTLGMICAIFLFVFTFLFLEKGKHSVLFYKIEPNGVTAGYVKIDLYKTEDKIVYKSSSFLPKELNQKITHDKLVFDRKTKSFEKFTREVKNSGTVVESILIKNNIDKTFDFLSKIRSKFSYVSDIGHASDISVFNENSPVTYIPIVDKYSFAEGGAQSFPIIYQPAAPLPPAKSNLILSSVRNDYIYSEGKRIKVELLLAKSRALPQCYIWVSKKNKMIVRLESKSNSFSIKKVAFPQKIAAENFVLQGPSYVAREVIIPSGDIALSGTMSIPEADGRLPGVLLVGGENPYDREEAGLFTYIANELAAKGCVVLRYDKRGMAKSQGENSSVDIENEISDIASAHKFISGHDKVDPGRIFVLGHGEACFYLSRLDFSKFPVRGILMLGILKPEPIMDFDSPLVSDRLKTLTKIDSGYEKILLRLKEETVKLVKDTKKDYGYIAGNRVFLKRMAQVLRLDPLKNFTDFNVPLLMIQGKRDRLGSPSYLNEIENALTQDGSQKVSTIYFRNENHFFGEIEALKNTVKHYRVNKEVLETISGWIGKNSAEILQET